MRRLAPIPLIVCAALVGCARSPAPPELDPSEKNLQAIYCAYKMTEIETHHIPHKLDDILDRLHEVEPADVLSSPNDGEPYIVCWGKTTSATSRRKKGAVKVFALLAYEKNGCEGKRFAVTTLGQVVCLTEEEFKQAEKLNVSNQHEKLKVSSR